MPRPDVRIFDRAEDLAQAAAEAFVESAQQAIARSGRFAVALAGGSTPKRLYRLLADAPYCRQIDWSRLLIFWNDERAVPPDHPESNYKMAWDALLGRVPIDPAHVWRMRGEARDADQAAADYQQQIAAALEVPAEGPAPSLDLILLGIGDDGHTASLFPFTEALEEPYRWVTANHVPQKQMNRLTMTLPILNGAGRVVFLVTGANKATVLRKILEGPRETGRLPAQAVRPTDGQLLWMVDRDAAAEL
jgi:6-phosphogluconolactonase